MPWISPTLPGSDSIVPFSGTGSSRLMFVGEAAGEQERQQHRPFVETAPAGSVLQRAFTKLGIDRSATTITNTVWWQPPNNFLDGAPWQGEAQGICRAWNQDLIERTKPAVIVALGKVAFHELTGLYEVDVTQGRGFIIPSKPEYGSIPVIGTYHPSYIVRGSKRKNQDTGAKTEKMSGGGWGYFSILLHDIALARQVVQSGCPELGDRLCSDKTNDVNLYGQADDWRRVIYEAKRDRTIPISYDFETPLSVAATDETEFERALGNITQFQVSLRPGHALVSSWDASLLPFIRELMELPNPKLDWNGRSFDRGILRDLNIKILGTYIDLMWMWHHHERDWPMGLQFATSFVSPEAGPWKHNFGVDLRTYGARDVHEPQKIYKYLVDRLKDKAVPGGKDCLSGYTRQVLTYQNVVFDQLQVRGIPVNNERREDLDRVLEVIETEVGNELQGLVPESIKPVKQKEGLKGLPSEWLQQIKDQCLAPAHIKLETAVEQGLYKRPTKAKLTAIHKELVEQAVTVIRDSAETKWTSSDGKVYVKREFLPNANHDFVSRWAELLPFNPNSSDQLQDYIAFKRDEEISDYKNDHAGKADLDVLQDRAEKKAQYRIPLDFKTRKPTTGKKELDRLISRTSDPVMSKVIECREMNKLRGTYIGKYVDGKPTGWAPWPDGRVHPFYYDGPATGQGAARDPAALTFPKHLTRKVEYQGKKVSLGKAIRSLVCARPGHRLVAADYKAFHVLTTGYEANDPLYMRLAKLDFHSFFAAGQILRVSKPEDMIALSDKDLLGFLSELRSDPTPRYSVPGFTDLQPFDFVRGKVAKAAGLGYGFGLQAPHLHHDNQEYIRSIALAQALIDGLDRQFPITCNWRHSIPHFAERQGGYLINKFGLIRKFNCLVDRFPVQNNYVPNPRRGETVVRGKDGQLWSQSPGDDNEACVAFLPASDAFGMIREAHLKLAGYENWDDVQPMHEDLLSRYGFIIPLHDENVFECEDRLVDELILKLKFEMERESDILKLLDGKGLSCEAEFSISPVGGSWAEMETLK